MATYQNENWGDAINFWIDWKSNIDLNISNNAILLGIYILKTITRTFIAKAGKRPNNILHQFHIITS